MSDLLSWILSAFVGMILGLIFDEPLHKIKKKILRTITICLQKLKPPRHASSQNFILGNRITDLFIIDGDGITKYAENQIQVVLVNPPSDFPGQINRFRERFDRQADLLRAEEKSVPWNGKLYSLKSFEVSRTPDQEDNLLKLYLYSVDYYTVSAVIKNLHTEYGNGRTLYQEYIQNYRFENHESYDLPCGFGMVLSVVTKDQYIIFCQRDDNSGFRSGESDISIVEGVNPALDNINGLNWHSIAKRALSEEICKVGNRGIPETEVDVNILGLIFDKQYNQWNLCGCIEIEQTSQEPIALRNSGIPGKWELKNIDFVPCEPEDVMKYLARHKMWDTAQLMAYWTLVFEGYSNRKINHWAAKLIE